jgi:tRNA (mo5U34)-methyltransferase
MRVYFDKLKDSIGAFGASLGALKSQLDPKFPWYPYHTLPNLLHVDSLVSPAMDQLFVPPQKFADIGAADGDLAFYLESMGYECDIYDNGPTNMNGLRGAKKIKAALNSRVEIFECDIDSQFNIEGPYNLIFFLGILYHLKNPFFALEKLSYVSSYMFISTKIARFFQPGGEDVSGIPSAYLVAPDETNNDPTNFWIFSDRGLKRIIERSGWSLIGYRTTGDIALSNPRDDDHDERAFALLKSRRI